MKCLKNKNKKKKKFKTSKAKPGKKAVNKDIILHQFNMMTLFLFTQPASPTSVLALSFFYFL